MSTLHELERTAGEDLAKRDYWAQARLHVLRDWINSRHPGTVIDVGCGSGYLSAEIDRSDRSVIGIDIDADSIAVANERDTTAEFHVDDALDLSFDDNTADAVVLADLIEHFDDPGPVLREARRVTRPDGRVFVSVPGLSWLFGPHDENQGHARRYNQEGLEDTAKKNGLSPVRMRYTNFFPLLPYTAFQRVLKRDVPSNVRGGHDSGWIEAGKQALLRAERSIPWPIGVTLLAELSPNAGRKELTTLLTNYEYPPGCGGGGVFTQDLRQALRSRDVSVPLVAGHNPSAWTVNGVVDLMVYPVRTYRDLKEMVRVESPDVINGHFSVPTSLFLPRLKSKTGVPYVVNVMGADVHDPTRYRRLRPALDLVNNHYVLKDADRIVVPSRDLMNRLPSRHHHKTERIPYFVDTDRFSPSNFERHNPLRLLTVTRLVPRKNLETALSVVAELLERGLAVEYTVIGDGSQLDDLKAEANSLGIDSVVNFAGYVPESELVSHYQSNDLFLLTSEHEGFGIAILEAMACGLPAVVSDAGGQTDILTPKTGSVVPVGHVGAYSTAVERVIADYSAMAESARDRVVKAFDREAITDRYVQLYREVAADAG